MLPAINTGLFYPAVLKNTTNFLFSPYISQFFNKRLVLEFR